MNKLYIFILPIFVCLSIVMLSCTSNNKDSDNHSPQSRSFEKDSVDIPISENKSDSILHSEIASREATFKIPDSIDKSRFVVAFYDSLCECPIAIVYNDAKQTKATRFTFYQDGKTAQKKLIPQSPTSFGERFEDWPEDKPHYEIYPEIVRYVHTNGSIGATYDVLKVD